MANITEKQFAQHFEHTSYYATTDGEVISFKGKQPKFIIQCKHGRGYTQFLVSNGRGNTKSYLTHRFVYECFYGEIPEGMQIHHIDHDKQNNALDNLQMVTDEENKLHSRLAGRPQGGLAAKLKRHPQISDGGIGDIIKRVQNKNKNKQYVYNTHWKYCCWFD